MEMNRAALQAASTGFRAVFADAMERAAPLWPGWMMEVTSTGSRETYHFGEMIGEMREWLGERQIEALERKPYTIDNRSWEKTVGVPVEAFEDDELGIYKLQIAQLGILARLHPDQLMVELLEDGFVELCYDGQPFFSATHPLKDGSTQSNLVSGALSETTFNSAMLKLRTMKSWGGRPVRPLSMGGKLTLTCGPANRALAKEILEKEYVDGGDSNINFGAAEVEVNDGIAGTHWMLGVKGGALAPFVLQTRKMAKLVEQTAPDSEQVFHLRRFLWGVDGRWNAGYGLYHMAVGSTGA